MDIHRPFIRIRQIIVAYDTAGILSSVSDKQIIVADDTTGIDTRRSSVSDKQIIVADDTTRIDTQDPFICIRQITLHICSQLESINAIAPNISFWDNSFSTFLS